MSSKEQQIRRTGAFRHIIHLDYREVDVSTSKADKTLASRTIVAADLFNSKDGSIGEIDRVLLWSYIDFGEDSGSANGLDLSTASDNQHTITVAGGTPDDIPFTIAGSKTGQHVSGDLECVANGGGGLILVADITDLTNSTLKDDVAQAIVHTLKDGIALGDNLRLKITDLIDITYNGKA